MYETISVILPNVGDWLEEYVTLILGFMGAGILLSFIFWSIAYAIDVAFGWVGSLGR